ncbi:MAG: hypothetical protein ACOYZ7_14645 [Chloroflexota bacterium]
MKKAFGFASTATLGLVLLASLLFAARGGLAQSPDDLPEPPTDQSQPPPLSLAAFGPAAGAGILGVSGSDVTAEQCYQANQPQTLCFTVYNGSTGWEWLDGVQLTFPALLGNWTVACNSQEATDSVGYPVSMSCSTPSANQLTYADSDSDGYGEISNGASWGFCADVTVPAAYEGPRTINWSLHGDDSNETSGQITIEPCTPLWFKSTTQNVEGCNGITQTHTFELWNFSAGSGTFNLTYQISPAGSVFDGPASFDLSDGEVVTFVVQLKPDFFLKAGQQVTATLSASGNGQSDQTVLVNTVTELAGWQTLTDTRVATMDNVVVWASHEDGGLWSIGGLGSDGATQRYDPAADAWQTFQPETVITPAIEYPIDGCYGLNGAGHEVVVLFPDTLVTDTLHIFDITDRSWYAEAIPAGYPEIGRWGHDIVSLLNHTGENVCYLSGGATRPGGGETRDLREYHPDNNTSRFIGSFFSDTVQVWFNFHASWYVPWVGDEGAICVAGGADHTHQINAHSQCFDLASETFNAADADLGPLPEPWWGMADGWQIVGGEYQIWLANGVAQDGTLLPVSAYASATSGGFAYGPAPPVSLYRLEGAGFQNQFVTVGGAQGGFWYSQHHMLLVACPTCHQNYLPTVLRGH